MTAATPSTRHLRNANWIGSRSAVLKKASTRPSNGTWIIHPGGNRFSSAQEDIDACKLCRPPRSFIQMTILSIHPLTSIAMLARKCRVLGREKRLPLRQIVGELRVGVSERDRLQTITCHPSSTRRRMVQSTRRIHRFKSVSLPRKIDQIVLRCGLAEARIWPWNL
jgi:hypothetical protein